MHLSQVTPFPGIRLLFVLLLSSVAVNAQNFSDSLSLAARELCGQDVIYDPSYYVIDYPDGDIPEGRGVCTDVIIRAYRSLDIDLQELVHQDMNSNFNLYPEIWNLTSPDKNIDHRRVPNLMKYFERRGITLTCSRRAEDYLAGDIVCWDLGGGLTHIGIVVYRKSKDEKRNMIVHNIGGGQVLEDFLFNKPIIGHYRYR
jgi:uncharacterized protein